MRLWGKGPERFREVYPKGPCTQIVYTLALKYSLYGYIGPKVCTIWVHGPLGLEKLGQGRLPSLFISRMALGPLKPGL